MSSSIKALLRRLLAKLIGFVGTWCVRGGLRAYVVNAARANVVDVLHKGQVYRFSAPNELCRWRAETFSSKEPETLDWIDSIPKGAVFWDVGANVGLYSVYAAMSRNCRVYSFEPSVFNLELLSKNIFINGLMDRVCIIPFALSDRTGPNSLHMTSTEWGGALSTFGEGFGWDGKPIQEVFEYQTMGVRMDEVAGSFRIPLADYIKMDVDGLEHFILSGGTAVLSRIKGILIEVNDDFQEQAEQCAQLLNQAGLILQDKRQSELVAGSAGGFQSAFNQIWARP